MNKSVLSKVRELVEPLVKALALELVDVDYVKEGGHWYLRIYIDKEGGVDIDDCSAVSQKVGSVLDTVNPIPQAYMLEVSSPGVERPLRKKEDFEKYKGELASIYTKETYQGFTCFTGNLEGLEDDQVILEYEGQKVSIPFDMVEKAHLTYEF